MANTVQFLDSKQAATGSVATEKNAVIGETTNAPAYNLEASDQFASDDIPF